MERIEATPVRSQDMGITDSVEVKFDDENSCGPWFPATIIDEVDSHSYLVVFRSGDGSFTKKIVDSEHIRPSPPSDSVPENFGFLHKVDCFYDFGWWPGLVAGLHQEDKDRYHVHLENQEERTFKKSELRFRVERIDGKWFQDSKEISAVRSNDGSTNVLRGKRGRLEKEHTGIQKKRGRPPKSLKTVLSTEGKGQKRRGRPPKSLRIDPATEVEALERSGKGRSSAGISSADLSTEGPEHFEASGMEIVGTAALTEPGVLIPSAEEDLHPSALLVGDNRGHEHERNSSQEMVVTVVVRDSVDLSNHCADEHQNPSVLLESTSPRRDTRGPEHSGTSGKGILDTVLVNEGGVLSPTAEDDLQLLVLPGVSQSPNRYEEAVAPQCWPFVKSSPMWETVESLNAFHLIPQHPHFQPLEQHSEAVREGLALGSMISFANLVDTTNSAKFDDVEGSLEANLVELSHFEELGFTVDAIRSRIQEVLRVKASCIKLEDGSKASESRLMEQNHRIDELQAQLDEIHGKLLAARTEKMELEKEITEFRESREAARLEFERVVSAPW